MPNLKRYRSDDVLTATRKRIAFVFDNFERVYISFSGGKDSSVTFHLVMEEAIKRNRVVGVLLIDLEAQYSATIQHARQMFELYREHIDLHWVCVPMLLQNAVSHFEPRWICWEPEKRDIWVREMPKEAKTEKDYPWYVPNMEFEEFVVIWGKWYGQGKLTAGFIGIRADESLNRFRTIAVFTKETFQGKRYTTWIDDKVYNIYPIYDWRTEDIWTFHAKHPHLPHNSVYDQMYRAGVPLSQQRLCQPYGVDQRRGLWLYHILESATWYKLIARVNGANFGALYIQETGNVNGYNKIMKPSGHSWKSFCNLLLRTLPKKTREHYIERFQSFIGGWRTRGYSVIPDETPKVLEDAHWAPSWRRMCKVLLRNDYWCKGLGMTQPKSDAYGKYLEIKRANAAKA